MAKTSDSGRFTPKKDPKAPTVSSAGGRPPGGATRAPAYTQSGRYTPPVPKELKVSPPWVPYLMFALLLLGLLVIILNYMELLPGAADNWYLVVGLAAITGGFITATQLR
jgi:hypothetical protein